MISSIYLSGEWLFSLSNNTLSVYQLGEFMGLGQKQLPNIQSPFGISLRQASVKLIINELSCGECRFVSLQEERQFGFISGRYDSKTIVSVEVNTLLIRIKDRNMCDNDNNGEKKNYSKNISIAWKYELQYEEEIGSVLCFFQGGDKEQQQLQTHKKLVINTTSGKIILLTQSQQSEQFCQHSSASLQALRSNNNNNSKPMQDENNNNYLSIYNQTQNHPSNQHKQYISAVNIKNNLLYCTTTKNRLFTVDQKIQLVCQFDTKQVNDKITNNNNGQDKHLVSQPSQPIKIIFIRNSLLILYSRHLFQFNTHTQTLINFLNLPFNTLDIIIQNNYKTQSTTLIMVGECNAFYSIPYPWNVDKQKFKRVSISSKLGKSILQSNNNYLFVGGCDGTIDVYKNASMHMMVLLQK